MKLRLANRVLKSIIGLWLLPMLLAASAPAADSVKTKVRTVTKLAEGVYAIRHPDSPDAFPQGNTTVIIGDHAVLVVDSCYLPAAAREDIAQIRQWTNKPVRYLVNTHWHSDHNMGNGVYAEAFPDLAIIAHHETQKQMQGHHPSWFAEYTAIRTARFKDPLDAGKNPDGTPLTELQKQDYQAGLAGVATVAAQFKALNARYANLTFNSELSLDLGNRTVELKHLGRGNTKGDAVVYLPKEKIVIVGDLLAHPVPYLGGGFPSELIVTLKKIAQLECETIVPGHGAVLQGQYSKTYLNQVLELVSLVVAQVNQVVYRVGSRPGNFDQVRAGVEAAVNVAAWRQKFAANDPDNRTFFDTFSWPGLLQAAYREVWGH